MDIPITYKEYNDTIKTDSTSTEIQINYHGFNSDIDNIKLKHNYYNKKETLIQQSKKVKPLIGFSIGPSIN